jgi:hypothetical protein
MDTYTYSQASVFIRGPFRPYNDALDGQRRSRDPLHRGPLENPFPRLETAWVFQCGGCPDTHALLGRDLHGVLFPCGERITTDDGYIADGHVCLARPLNGLSIYSQRPQGVISPNGISYLLEWQRQLAKLGLMGNVLLATTGPLQCHHKEIFSLDARAPGFSGVPTYEGNDFCLVIEVGSHKQFDTSQLTITGHHLTVPADAFNEILTGRTGAWWDWTGRVFKAHYASRVALSLRGQNTQRRPDKERAVIFDVDAAPDLYHPYVEVIRERPTPELLKTKWSAAIYITNGEDMHSKALRALMPHKSFSASKRSLLSGSAFANAVKEAARRNDIPYNAVAGIWSRPKAANTPAFDSRLLFTTHSVAAHLAATGKIKAIVFAMGPGENLPARLPAPLELLPDTAKFAVRAWGPGPYELYAPGGIVLASSEWDGTAGRIRYGNEEVLGMGLLTNQILPSQTAG